MSFLWLRVGGASITKSRFIGHLRGTTTWDIITGIKILGGRICYWRRPVGRITDCWRLTTEEEKRGRNTENHPSETKGEYVPENPDDRHSLYLTSANLFDWWVLLVSQTSCSFCLSWDRVSCTDFKEASTGDRFLKKGFRGNLDVHSTFLCIFLVYLFACVHLFFLTS